MTATIPGDVTLDQASGQPVSAEIRAMIVDPPFPQLTELARGLAEFSELDTYIHPFLDLDGSLLQRAQTLPLVGNRASVEFRRRALPDGIPAERVQLAGTRYEFARYLLHHLKRRTGFGAGPLQRRAIFARNVQLSLSAARHLGGINTLIASFGTALEAFQAAEGKSILKVVDYPIAYYAYSIRLLEIEAQRHPEYARTLQSYDITPRFSQRVDQELDLADLVFVGSDFAKRSFTESGFDGSKLVVVPYGADLSLFHPIPSEQRSDNGFEVLFVGQIGQRKGIADLFEAYRLIRRPDTRLHLVGNYVGDPSVVARERELYQYTPHQPRWKLPDIYRQASVFVLPTHVEGMPLVVLEAMASGTPVIVTDRGPDQVVRDGVDGFVVPAGDVDALAERLEFLRDHPDVAAKMGEAASQRATEFSWTTYVERVRNELAARIL